MVLPLVKRPLIPFSVLKVTFLCKERQVSNLFAQKPLFTKPTINNRASSRENLSLEFATRVDSNQPAQLQRLARGLKFWI